MIDDSQADGEELESPLDANETHSQRAIARLKRSLLRPGQFRLATLFVAISLLAIWAHCLDVAAFGGTSSRDPNSFWNRFTLALARLQERGGESVFRCCRCQRIRADADRHRREDGWLCHECYLSEIRHSEALDIPEYEDPSPGENATASKHDDRASP